MSATGVISGKVVAIFYQNPSNFFKVLLVKVTENDLEYDEPEIVITGSFGEVQEGEEYRFTGELVNHPKYGRQMKAESYQQAQPTSAAGLIHFFASDKFPGIGRKTAEKIVDALGEGAIDRLLADPAVLADIPGLTKAKQKMIVDTVRANHGMDQVIVALTQYGFGSQLAFAIYQTYKEATLDILHENPYQLVEDIEGIGFKKADQLAEGLGIAADSTQRIQACVMQQLASAGATSGDTFVPAQELLEQVLEVLESSRPVEIQPEALANEIIHLVEAGKIQQEGTNLYENSLYFAEWGIASSVQRLLQRKQSLSYDKKRISRELKKIEKQMNISYGSSQEEAIRAAITSPLFLLTGGPGTGKTTVINGIVKLFAALNDVDLSPHNTGHEGFPIYLAAPTGRAAKRMNETTGLPAGTIHRLLGINGREKVPSLNARELSGGLLILDEMSMVDTWLANTLFKAIGNDMQVIIVGDKDQLPSVGPGQVLHDLLQTTEIPQRELTEIYRQGDGSSIISLAHEIKDGQVPANLTVNQKDRSFFRCDAYQIEPIIAQIVEKAKAKGFTAQDIQVLAPMYRGPAGINALNKMMQEIFNPNDGNKREVVFNEVAYRVGDKVLQLVNDPEANVFNGDMGVIVGITYAKESEDKTDELTIAFDATEVVYKRNEWNKITLSYCCSIHKSQGSEFKMVILPMVSQYQRMLQRNLLYTAVTRSKDLLILLGEPRAYEQAIYRESAVRKTTLQQRIQEVGGISTALTMKIHQYEDEMAAETHGLVTSLPLAKNELPQETKSSADKLAEVPQEQKPSIQYDQVTTEPKVPQEIIEETPTEDHRLTLAMITNNQVDPLIGMTGITPWQFQAQ
ncbi:ATP-dependent RecD-like DNA helicase [Enterococcus asini]|uniref:ATP-dependent RecD2 DNA helicase n=1 Tax=Enterococcus asini TaxID=57732 RepID=A0AAW8TVT1_9ENTE|nr:ATP-dependent RecD-like DNA helicase [Enterococcus asini]MDT2809789.1 ATP-dependent RecD-like DNA helicase [Enterococcus asini]